MTTADEVFAKARKPFDERKHVRLRGRFAHKMKSASDPTELKRQEIFARYQAEFDKIDSASPIDKKTTRAQQQKIMSGRAKAKAEKSLQMYTELKRLGETNESLYNAKQVGDPAYLKPKFRGEVEKAWETDASKLNTAAFKLRRSRSNRFDIKPGQNHPGNSPYKAERYKHGELGNDIGYDPTADDRAGEHKLRRPITDKLKHWNRAGFDINKPDRLRYRGITDVPNKTDLDYKHPRRRFLDIDAERRMRQ